MKRSGAKRPAQSPPEGGPTLFLDRNLGRYEVASALRNAGALVEIHDDHFAADCPDTVWLSELGKRDWILLTQDQNILTRPLEFIALFEANIVACILRSPRRDLRGKEVAEIFCKALPQIVSLTRRHGPPLVAQVTATGRVGRIEGYKELQERLRGAKK